MYKLPEELELPTEKIPIPDCIKGRVYKLHCRNLQYGVYDGKNGFIGIRTKFGSRYLFTELHLDADESFGTVKAMEDTGTDVPDDIEVVENYFLDDKTFEHNKALFEFLDRFKE